MPAHWQDCAIAIVTPVPSVWHSSAITVANVCVPLIAILSNREAGGMPLTYRRFFNYFLICLYRCYYVNYALRRYEISLKLALG